MQSSYVVGVSADSMDIARGINDATHVRHFSDVVSNFGASCDDLRQSFEVIVACIQPRAETFESLLQYWLAFFDIERGALWPFLYSHPWLGYLASLSSVETLSIALLRKIDKGWRTCSALAFKVSKVQV
jgi:hypothetical protein